MLFTIVGLYESAPLDRDPPKPSTPPARLTRVRHEGRGCVKAFGLLVGAYSLGAAGASVAGHTCHIQERMHSREQQAHSVSKISTHCVLSGVSSRTVEIEKALHVPALGWVCNTSCLNPDRCLHHVAGILVSLRLGPRSPEPGCGAWHTACLPFCARQERVETVLCQGSRMLPVGSRTSP